MCHHVLLATVFAVMLSAVTARGRAVQSWRPCRTCIFVDNGPPPTSVRTCQLRIVLDVDNSKSMSDYANTATIKQFMHLLLRYLPRSESFTRDSVQYAMIKHAAAMNEKRDRVVLELPLYSTSAQMRGAIDALSFDWHGIGGQIAKSLLLTKTVLQRESLHRVAVIISSGTQFTQKEIKDNAGALRAANVHTYSILTNNQTLYGLKEPPNAYGQQQKDWRYLAMEWASGCPDEFKPCPRLMLLKNDNADQVAKDLVKQLKALCNSDGTLGVPDHELGGNLRPRAGTRG